MERRLMGEEMEFGLISSNKRYDDGTDLVERIVAFLKKETITTEDLHPMFLNQCEFPGDYEALMINPHGGGYDVRLVNGTRVYLSSNHLEFSGGECDNPFDLSATSMGLQRIAEAVVRKFQRMNPELGKLRLFKNSVALDSTKTSGERTTYASSHENYLMEREAWERRENLIPHLVTRQVFAAPGGVRTEPINSAWKGFDSYFELSSRVQFIEKVEASNTTSKRPILNTKDVSYIDKKYRRLHVIVGESNHCAYTTALRFGTTHLVLRLMEEVEGFNVPELDEPVEAIQQISIHPYWSLTFKDKRHKKRTACEIQRDFFWEPANEHFRGTNRQTDWILDHWDLTLRDVEGSRTQIPQDGAGGVGYVDWFTRYDAVMRRLEAVKGMLNAEEYEMHYGKGNKRSDHLDVSSEEDRWFLRNQDLQFDDLDMETGLVYAIPMKALCWPTSPDYVLQKIHEPCLNTRSAVRSFVRKFYSEELESENWDGVSLKNGRGKLDLKKEPFADSEIMNRFYENGVPLEVFLDYCEDQGILARPLQHANQNYKL